MSSTGQIAYGNLSSGVVRRDDCNRPLNPAYAAQSLTLCAQSLSLWRAIKSILGRVILDIAPPTWMMVLPREPFAGHVMVASDPLS